MGHLALTDGEALHLIGSLALIFVLAHLLGALARRLRQPSVVGYLLAGLALGRSGLGAAWPAAASFFLPARGESHLLGAVIEFSLLMVLIVLGAETDLPLVRRLGRPVVGITAGSILVPLAAGSAVAYAFAPGLVIGDHLAGSVLVGGALGVSSLPIIAKLVDELGIARRDVGQLALATATASDVYGFVLLAVVGATAGAAGPLSVALPLAGLVGLVVVFVVLGQRCVDFLLRKVRQDGPNPTGGIAVAVAVALGAAAVMQAVGVEAALGAFFAGVGIGRSRFQHGEALARLQSFSDAVFAPLYFASAGLLIDLGAINSGRRVFELVALLVVAVTSKALGAAAAARGAGLRGREIGALSTLLNGRGAMQVIIATAGLRMGLLSGVAYTSVLAVSIVSSVLVAPTLRRVVGHWQGSEEERRRLDYEARIESSVLVRQQRLLVPVLAGTAPALAATLLDRAWPDAAEMTVLSATPEADAPAFATVRRPIRQRPLAEDDGLNGVLEEAALGYGVIGLGVASAANEPPEVVAQLLNRTPLPAVLVYAGGVGAERLGSPRGIAVATTGATAGIAAEELATSIADRHGAPLHIVHIEPASDAPGTAAGGRPLRPGADGVLADAAGRAARSGLRPRIAHHRASSVAAGLTGFLRRHEIDLLVVGARLRRVGDAPFLGHTVEELLRTPLPVAIAVVAFPEGAPSELDQPYVERELI